MWKHNKSAAKSASKRECVIKPYRGVASDGVFRCKNLSEAQKAFTALYNKPQYGGGINEAVLVQECVSGTEYAVDTVAKNGDIKVSALWRYKKLAANGAPFVYQCSELVSAFGEEERAVCNYCIEVLKAQGIVGMRGRRAKHICHYILCHFYSFFSYQADWLKRFSSEVILSYFLRIFHTSETALQD